MQVESSREGGVNQIKVGYKELRSHFGSHRLAWSNFCYASSFWANKSLNGISGSNGDMAKARERGGRGGTAQAGTTRKIRSSACTVRRVPPPSVRPHSFWSPRIPTHFHVCACEGSGIRQSRLSVGETIRRKEILTQLESGIWIGSAEFGFAGGWEGKVDPGVGESVYRGGTPLPPIWES